MLVVSHGFLLFCVFLFVSCLRRACLSRGVFITSNKFSKDVSTEHFCVFKISVLFKFFKFKCPLFLYCFFFSVLFIVSYKRNCTKWSKIEKMRLQITSDSLTVFMKILLISLPEQGVILVGIVICKDKDLEYKWFKKSLVWVYDS